MPPRKTTPKTTASRPAPGAKQPGQPAPHRLLVRMPESLYQLLEAEATGDGVSVNTMTVALLASGLGWRAPDERKRGRR